MDTLLIEFYKSNCFRTDQLNFYYQFVENLASKPCILENKVKLMKDIATEFSIKWDSKAFEQRMNKPSTFEHVCPTLL